MTIATGRMPWIELGLAGSFAAYSLLKKTIGVQVDALTGMTGETLVLAPLAAGYVAWLSLCDHSTFESNPPRQALLLMASGPITVVTLIFFAAAARRVPLSTLGLMQYLAPTLQLLCGVVVLGEHMTWQRWTGFVLVWTALAVLATDAIGTNQRAKDSRLRPQGRADLIRSSTNAELPGE